MGDIGVKSFYFDLDLIMILEVKKNVRCDLRSIPPLALDQWWSTLICVTINCSRIGFSLEEVKFHNLNFPIPLWLLPFRLVYALGSLLGPLKLEAFGVGLGQVFRPDIQNGLQIGHLINEFNFSLVIKAQLNSNWSENFLLCCLFMFDIFVDLIDNCWYVNLMG